MKQLTLLLATLACVSPSHQQGCSQDLQVGFDAPVIILSPNFPKPYPVATQCNWKVTGPENSRLMVRFNDFALQPTLNSVCQDYLDISEQLLDGKVLMGKRCGSRRPQDMKTYANEVLFRMFSDARVTSLGFDITIFADAIAPMEESMVSVFLNANDPPYQVNSTGYPASYPSFFNQSWRFDTSPGFIIDVEVVDFNVHESEECLEDFVQLTQRASRTELAKLCGPQSNRVVRTSEEHLDIQFRSGKVRMLNRKFALLVSVRTAPTTTTPLDTTAIPTIKTSSKSTSPVTTALTSEGPDGEVRLKTRIQLVRYENPDNLKPDGKKCDVAIGSGRNCDPIFYVSYTWGPGLSVEQKYGYFGDATTYDFSAEDGLDVEVSSGTGITVDIRVTDSDFLSEELIGNMTFNYTPTGEESVEQSGQGGYATVKVRFTTLKA